MNGQSNALAFLFPVPTGQKMWWLCPRATTDGQQKGNSFASSGNQNLVL